MKKKILWITDDQIHYKELYKKIFSWVGELTLTDKFIFDEKYDFVLVDYGHIGNINNAMVLKKYYNKNIRIIWTGGLGGCDYYEKDCKKTFPNELWMHTIESFELRDLSFSVNRELNKFYNS